MVVDLQTGQISLTGWECYVGCANKYIGTASDEWLVFHRWREPEPNRERVHKVIVVSPVDLETAVYTLTLAPDIRVQVAVHQDIIYLMKERPYHQLIMWKP